MLRARFFFPRLAAAHPPNRELFQLPIRFQAPILPWNVVAPRLLPCHHPSLSLARCSSCGPDCSAEHDSPDDLKQAFLQHNTHKQKNLEPGLYLVGTPIGNMEDITLRALRVLRSADVILSEDTRHSKKLLQNYSIDTPLLSYHKFNEHQREAVIVQKLHERQIIALISDAGTPGISDPGMELVKRCISESILVTPIPGPSALVTALSASGLATNEFTFVGFLPKNAGSRKEKMRDSACQTATQIFFVPPHSLVQILVEASSFFGDDRFCVIAREMTKIHEEFWRGTLGDAKRVFAEKQPKGEITLLIEGRLNVVIEPSEAELESELKQLISNGNSLSRAVKLVSEAMSVQKKQVYALALRKFGRKIEEKVEQP